jgi:hypothetical protein
VEGFCERVNEPLDSINRVFLHQLADCYFLEDESVPSS